MAGAGYKLFNTGDVLTAAQVNTYLQEQVVMVFASATARTTALSGVLAEGMVSYLKDTNATEVYDGSAWVGIGNSGDITGITTGATSGLTGGVTSGTADLKLNTTAKGGLLVGTGSGTSSELAVGTNNQVLTADSTTATGLKWAAAAAGGGDLVRITTASFSSATAASVDSVFSSTYDNYLILLNVQTTSGSNAMNLRFRTSGSDNTTSNYGSGWMYQAFGSGGASGNLGSAAGTNLAYIQDITGNPTSNVMTVFNPYATQNTFASWSVVQGNNYRSTGGLEFDATTSFDGISFLCAAGTFGGTISVYGYKKS